jgi:hypothetical protein
MTDAERIKLLASSPKRSTRSPALGRPLERPTDVDGLPMFDHHRSPTLFTTTQKDKTP